MDCPRCLKHMARTTDKKSILIVEDDPFIAMDLEDTFIAHGYEVLGPFADVESSLKLLDEQTPDLAMVDYNLGKDTSIILAQTLHRKDVPFVFLSGQVEHVVIGHDLPPRPVVPKPFVPSHLVGVAENLI